MTKFSSHRETFSMSNVEPIWRLIGSTLDIEKVSRGPSWSWSYGSWIYNYLCNQCLSSLMLWVRISIRERCTTLYDKVGQWLATGQRFSPGTPVSSTNKTGCHDITEILLEMALNTIKQTNKQYIFFSSIYAYPHVKN